jgi:SepF-like predicted cell division protein (DUF552 family)
MTSQDKYYDALIAYSKAIMAKSIADSDQAVRAISSVMEILLADASRISKMSADTLNAMKGLQSTVTNVGSEIPSVALKKLIVTLSGIAKEHRAAHEMLMPIIEALQFQDAIRQQMENLGKVMDIWLSSRKELGANPSSENLKAIGEKLLKVTAMVSERDIIRSHIKGLPVESKADDVMLF